MTIHFRPVSVKGNNQDNPKLDVTPSAPVTPDKTLKAKPKISDAGKNESADDKPEPSR